jgi:penicillin-binding protein 1C
MKRRLAACTLFASGALLAAMWLRLGPLPEGLLADRQDLSTTVVDRNGEVLYESRSEEGTRSTKLAEDALPLNLVLATIAAEDRRFYRHPGIDPLAIGRAALRDLLAGAVIEGGSTITQQVAKLLLDRANGANAAEEAASGTGRRAPSAAAALGTGWGPRERSGVERGEGPPRLIKKRRGLAAKIREAVVALRLDHRLSKREILALYLNLAPYGNQIQGAERASRAYFGCQAGLLTPAQAALLAGLPQQPSRFNPYRNSRVALARQRHVIDRMTSLGLISPAIASEARAEHLVFRPDESTFVAPHFVEMALADYGSTRPNRIETTLDLELQRAVEGIIRSQRPSLEAHRAHNVAVVVLKNETGEWLAWEGSGNYFDADHGGAINGPLALRQPGSALKPFTYALAFEEGRSPASVLPDVPSHFPTAEEGVVYSPRNYDGQYRGPLLIRRALAGSENVPAVALTLEIGVPKLVRFLRSAGLSTFDKTAAYYGLGITLGNAEVRLAELVGAYAAFARGGMLMEPTAVRVGERRLTRLVSTRSAFWITDVLSDPAAREYIFGRGGSLEFPFAVAAKTGTSEGYHDNWAIGYTREVTVGVWVGNFDRSPLTNSSGVTGAGPIFHAVMLEAERRFGHPVEPDAPLAAVPGDLVRTPICSLSGMRATPWCPARINEWLPADDRGLPCSWHHESDEGVLTIWPPAYRQWARAQGLLDEEQVHRVALAHDEETAHHHRPSRIPSAETRRFEIANPPAGAIYLIDPTLRSQYQTLPLRASADREAGQVEWAVDGLSVGRSESDKPLPWPLTPGEHRIAARDRRGRTAETRIVVK